MCLCFPAQASQLGRLVGRMMSKPILLLLLLLDYRIKPPTLFPPKLCHAKYALYRSNGGVRTMDGSLV